MAGKKDALAAAYRRERRRIQNYISGRRRKGFRLDFELPKIPKKVTEGSINRLKKITPSKIRESEYAYVDQEGNVTVGEHWTLTKAYKDAVRAEREEFEWYGTVPEKPIGKKPKLRKADVIWSNVQYTMSQLPESVVPILQDMFGSAIDDFGLPAVMEVVDRLAGQGKPFSVYTLYSIGAVMNYSRSLFEELGAGELALAELEERLEEENDYEYQMALGEYD